MEQTTKYYVGEKFDSSTNKAYKTLDGAQKAADKNGLRVFDDSGAQIYPATAADSSPTEKMTQDSAETPDNISEGNFTNETENGDSGAHSEKESYSDDIDAVALTEADSSPAETEAFDGVLAVKIKGKIKQIFNGNLRVRNSPSWNNLAVRGVTRFSEKRVTHRLMVDNIPMYRTIDGYFISGAPELVKFIED